MTGKERSSPYLVLWGEQTVADAGSSSPTTGSVAELTRSFFSPDRFRASSPWMLVAVPLAADIAAVLAAWTLVAEEHKAFALLTGACALVLLGLQSAYRARFHYSTWDDMPRLIGTVFAAGAGVGLSLSLVGSAWAFSGSAVALLATALVVGRALAYLVIHLIRRFGFGGQRVLIVGAGSVGAELGDQMVSDPRLGLNLVGYAELGPQTAFRELPAPVLGAPAELDELVRAFEVSQVVIAYPVVHSGDLVHVIRSCRKTAVKVAVVPRLHELAPMRGTHDSIHGIPLVRLPDAALDSPAWAVKRLFDIFASGLALLLLAPTLATIALVLRVAEGPGVLFRQTRVGVGGETFELLKFRSMKPQTSADSEVLWSIKADARVSPLGRFLRRSSLDELPQLINILKGDMSLVGPRPERPHFVQIFSESYDRYADRHRVPVGLTGWAQIHGLRGDTSIVDRIRYDNYYIDNWSLWLDVKIVCRTAASFLKGSG